MSATVFFADGNEFADLQNIFKVNGVPADATTVTLTITDPTGATTTPSVTHAGTGTYTAQVACTLAGIWTYLWEGTGTASDAQAGTWTVTTVALNQRYCSVEELKSRLGITDTADDFELQMAVDAASRAIDQICGRHFYRVTETRTYIPRSLYETRIDDIVSVSALATDPGGTAAQGGTFPVSWPAGSFQLLPYNPNRHGEPWPYTRIKAVGGLTFPWVIALLLARLDRVQVTGAFGWPAVPQAVRGAALISAADLFRLKDAPFGIAGFGEFAVRVQANPRVMGLLDPYVRVLPVAA